MTTITCKRHNEEFEPLDGCPQCLEERIKNTQEDLELGDIIEDGLESLDDNQKPATEQPETTAVININPLVEQDVTKLFDEIQMVAEKAEAFTVTSQSDVKLATNDLSIIAGIKKRAEAKKKEYLAPLEEHKKSITAFFAQLLDPINFADKTLRDKTKTFLAEEQRKADEARRIAEEEQALARRKAALNGEPEPKREIIPTIHVQTSHQAELGKSGMMDVWKWEIVDRELIPRHYMKVDDAAITKAVKASHDTQSIPGIRIFNEPTLRVEGNK